MKKFKVIVLSLSGLGNKIFESGDTVTQDAFPEGTVDKLVKEGFLEPLDDEESEKLDLENSNAMVLPRIILALILLRITLRWMRNRTLKTKIKTKIKIKFC
ncbi:MAG: hypothetical protein U0T32_11940 [Chitinophagales bacterium]